MKSVPLLSSQDGSGRVQLKDFDPTRNRKVEGSNPSSGSISAGQRASLALATALMGQAVIPWAGSSCRGLPSPLGCEESSSDGTHVDRPCIVAHSGEKEGQPICRPCGPVCTRATQETS
jgi:hypothetical protein